MFSYELTLLTYIYTYVVRFTGVEGALNFGSLFSFIMDIFCVFSDDVDIFG